MIFHGRTTESEERAQIAMLDGGVRLWRVTCDPSNISCTALFEQVTWVQAVLMKEPSLPISRLVRNEWSVRMAFCGKYRGKRKSEQAQKEDDV